MSTTTTLATAEPKQEGVKQFFAREDVRKKFEEMLGKRHTQFITSVLQIVASNDLLSKADPISIFNSAATAATLDLPLNNNLGFAYIVPYNIKKDGISKVVAQFQMGYKGFIQLVQRTGQAKSIYATEIYEGQLVDENPLDGYTFDFNSKTSDTIIGYACRIKLINGFEATLYMSKEKLIAHGKRFSQTYKKGYGLWSDDFDSMAKKTVTKLLLSRYAPMSVELSRAVVSDQAIINDADTQDVTYIDNDANAELQPPSKESKEADRAIAVAKAQIAKCKTAVEINALREEFPDVDAAIFDEAIENMGGAK